MHGYWHSFMKKQTSSVADSAGTTKSHQRIVGYQFAGMNMLVSYEADGHLPHPHAELGMSYSQDQTKANDMMEEDLATYTKNMVLYNGLKVVAGKAGDEMWAVQESIH